MKDFATVGRRLRRWRIFAIVVTAFGLVLCTSGVAAYWDHGPPAQWVMGDAFHSSHYVPIPPEDPDYSAILRNRESELMYFLLWASGFMAAGALAYAASRKAPAKETLHLAQARGGVLTLPEVSTAFDIDPRLAARALSELQKLKIAIPRWQDYRKNIWEFPDYMDLPSSPSVDLTHDAAASSERFLPAGQNREIAHQAINTPAEKSAAQNDPSAAVPAMVATPQ